MQNFDYKSRRANKGQFEMKDSRYSYGNVEMETGSRYQQLKEFYEMRLREFGDTLANTVSSITNDPLLITMKGEATSQQFIMQRIQEIIEECIYSDRESLLKQLSHQNTLLEADYQKLEIEYENVREYFNRG